MTPTHPSGQRIHEIVDLAQATIHVTDPGGVLTVTIDGHPYPPPEHQPWTRTSFGQLIDAITEQRSRGIRIDVHETDGTTFTDIIWPTTPQPPSSPHPHRRKTPAPKPTVSGDGFQPGETVLIAHITGHSDANADGHITVENTTRRRLPRTTQLVLIGQTSRTLIIVDPQ